MVHGKYSQRDYELRRCDVCRFAFIADPWTDFERIYDDRYYDGHGADPLVDYRFELSEPERTIRRYEWHGVTRLVERLLGGLDGVRGSISAAATAASSATCSSDTGATACGFEEGSIATAARGSASRSCQRTRWASRARASTW